jgi:tetratricopeptide (TPR) repeat protein
MSISKLKDEARRHEQKEEWDKAITAYLQVLRIGDDAGDVELPLYNRIGDLCVRLGRAGDAVRYYEQAADRYAEVGLYNNAMALCNKALRYRPDHVALLRKLGQFSALQGFLTEARDYYVEYADQQIRTGHADAAFDALRDFANIVGDGDTRELLGRRLRSQGRDGEAVTELQRAYALHLQAGNATAAQAVAAEILAVDPGATLSDVAHADGDHGAGPGLADGGELPRLDDLVVPTMAPDPDVWVDADEDAGGSDDGLADEADPTPEPSPFGGFVGGVDADAEMYGVMRFGSDPEDSAEADVGDEDAGADEDALADGVLEVEGRDGTNLDSGSGSRGLTGLDLGLDFDAVQADAASDDPASWERDDGLAPGGDDGAFDETDYGLPLLGDDPPAFDLPLLGDTGPGEADDDGLPEIGDAEHPSAPWRIGEFDDAAGFEPASFEGTEGRDVAGDPSAGDPSAGEPRAGEPWAGMSGDDPDAGGADDSDDDSPPDHEFDSALFDAAAFGIPVIRGSPSEPPAHGAPADGFDPVAGPMADWFAGPHSPDADDARSSSAAQSDVDATGVAGGEAVGDAEDGWPRAADADDGEAEGSRDGQDDIAADMGLPREVAGSAEHLPPEDAAAHYDLGLAFKEMGPLDEAIAEFQIALRAGHMRLKVYEELGDCFLRRSSTTSPRRCCGGRSPDDVRRRARAARRLLSSRPRVRGAGPSIRRVTRTSACSAWTSISRTCRSGSRGFDTSWRAAVTCRRSLNVRSRPFMLRTRTPKLSQIQRPVRDDARARRRRAAAHRALRFPRDRRGERSPALGAGQAVPSDAAAAEQPHRRGGPPPRRHAGAIVELVHLATLVHDDAVDHSVLRRGMPTVNALWNHQTAVIMGDYLYSRSISALAELGGSTHPCCPGRPTR